MDTDVTLDADSGEAALRVGDYVLGRVLGEGAFVAAGAGDEAEAALREGLGRVRGQLARLEDPQLQATLVAMAECRGIVAHARRGGLDVVDLERFG